MKQTSGKHFLDTNIIIYAHSDVEPKKQKIAQRIISENETTISTQVLQEAANTLTRKFKHTWKEISKVLEEAATNNVLHTNKNDTILAACNIADRYGFSFYDSLIIAAALECGCSTLYSEDMQDEQVIENSLIIVNPFN
ncbi:MAG: PIN domain-containing protein [Bacteroidetes bacterium]|jgi:predicted nucleic acid-binding protein|nr:PIN domain-containing protein [Bacteroidota bacterium]